MVPLSNLVPCDGKNQEIIPDLRRFGRDMGAAGTNERTSPSRGRSFYAIGAQPGESGRRIFNSCKLAVAAREKKRETAIRTRVSPGFYVAIMLRVMNAARHAERDRYGRSRAV